MCFEPVNADCAVLPYCALRKALARARDAFVDVLDDYALSDLVKPRASLQALLSIAPLEPARAPTTKKRRGQAGRAR
jgi:Rrf2 family nitric oxide-sensitive transcriptional repressor